MLKSNKFKNTNIFAVIFSTLENCYLCIVIGN